ncbi:Monocarboxylate transporter 2 [Holothuria leucospilota]|uniref:Monocarboxylate transporter 2 n=1 Tax=Holothuria leucospilota TaxID=206669 RepID=A0A9Q1HM00_HOLLE|nr:Monocarboxylate transporter 2 [Holothuria leucospilota]
MDPSKNNIQATDICGPEEFSVGKGPFASLLLRVFTRRQVAVFGGCLIGTSYIYCGLCLKSVWQLFFAYTVAGIGLGLHMFAGYLNFCEHFHDNLGTAVSVAALSSFLGLATLPVFFQYLKTSFGLDNKLVLFGDFLLNFIVSAVAVSKPVRNLKQIQAVEAKQPDKEETCSFSKANNVDRNRYVEKEENNFQIYVRAWFAMFNHQNLAGIMVLEGLMFYIFVSWGLFLVSVGTSAGLNPDQAVLLSSTGGIGGFCGKLVAVELFRTEKMNAFTSTLLPLLCNAICFAGCALVRSFHPILLFTFVSGACIGVNSSGLIGLLPTMVCKSHFHQAFVTASFIEGIAMQLAGFTSGTLILKSLSLNFMDYFL